MERDSRQPFRGNVMENKKRAWVMPVVLIAIGIAFLLVGIYNGEMTEVFKKATVICLECIGIG